MSIHDEPYNEQQLRRLFAELDVSYKSHAVDQMKKRKLDESDLGNVLRSGKLCETAAYRTWFRYTMWTPKMSFVVEFKEYPDVTVVRVVTGWRKNDL